MVYCGKPSRGCQMCRTRRIKCDETKPTCLQCQKSRRQCPGYKDDFDLVFRNETQATERRARRALNSKRVNAQITFTDQQSMFPDINKGNNVNDGSEEFALIPATSKKPNELIVIPALSIPIDQQAPCFFISNFVLEPREAARGYFDFLEPMLKNESPDSHFSMAFAAVALATLGSRPNTRGRSVFPQALALYTKALKALNLALQSPVHQKTDQTLAAILMLGFFENVASEKSNAMAWYSHIDGAVQLVKLRGKKQLRTKVGYSLFMCVRSQMVIQCITVSKAPSLGTDWWISEASNDQYSAFAARLNLRIAELRAKVNLALATFPRTPEYCQEVLNLIKTAQGLENEFVAWEENLPAELKPHTVAWIDSSSNGQIKDDLFPGKIDMFNDLWVAVLWNSLRIARLLISGIIVRCAAWICSPVDYRTTPEYATSSRVSYDIISDVIASIPYTLGWRMDASGALKCFNYITKPDAMTFPQSLGAFFLIWPLFSISNTDYISDSQRAYTKGRMAYISDNFGIKHAKVLSQYQLRLPSMIIRRDAMAHTATNSHLTITQTARPAIPSPVSSNGFNTAVVTTSSPNPVSPTTPVSVVGTTPVSSILPESPSVPQNIGAGTSAGSTPASSYYALSPLQQREAMQRASWEKEKKTILKKASGNQGESVERLLANYLAV